MLNIIYSLFVLIDVVLVVLEVSFSNLLENIKLSPL